MTNFKFERRSLRFADKVQSIFFLVELLLGLRVFFLLAGSASLGFVNFIYTITNPLVWPFRLLVPSMQLGNYHYDPASAIALVALPLIIKVALNVWHAWRLQKGLARKSSQMAMLP